MLLLYFPFSVFVRYVAFEICVFGINISRWRCKMWDMLCFSPCLSQLERKASPEFQVC